MGFSGRQSPEQRAAATVVGFEGLPENLEDESSLCFGPQSRGKCVVDDEGFAEDTVKMRGKISPEFFCAPEDQFRERDLAVLVG
ncbi:hypothetical protein U1Q18_002532 [Sarracenia purpurea var. burkii]